MSRIPKGVVALVLSRDGGVCMLRLSPDCLGVATVADHRANRGIGGAKTTLDQPSNLVAACGICNGAKESSADREALVASGLRVPAGRTHAHTAEKARTTPVQYRDGWFFLDDDGGRHPVGG